MYPWIWQYQARAEPLEPSLTQLPPTLSWWRPISQPTYPFPPRPHGGMINILAPFTVVTETLTGSGTWTAPANIFSNNITMECWGGGAGGNQWATTFGGGGGGGAYSKTTAVVSSGTSYSVGAGGNNSNVPGSDTFFGSVCIAKGGGIGVPSGGQGLGGAGGSAASGTGDIKFSGGDGGHGGIVGSISNGGGGGTSAGPAANGNTGASATAGGGGSATTAPSGGGDGGRGASDDSITNATAGSFPGGGGGGGAQFGTFLFGATGANGSIKLTYAVHAAPEIRMFWFPPTNQPVMLGRKLVREGLYTSPIVATIPAPPVVAPDIPFHQVCDPTLPARRTAPHPDAVQPLEPSLTQAPPVLSWWQPTSIPTRRIPYRFPDEQFERIDPTIFISPPELSWFQPASEPVRPRRFHGTGEQFERIDPFSIIAPPEISWLQPTSQPQFRPPPRITGDQIFEFEPSLITSPPELSWWQPISEPVFRTPPRPQGEQFERIDPSLFVTIPEMSWWQPASLPIWAIKLRPMALQARDPLPPGVTPMIGSTEIVSLGLTRRQLVALELEIVRTKTFELGRNSQVDMEIER